MDKFLLCPTEVPIHFLVEPIPLLILLPHKFDGLQMSLQLLSHLCAGPLNLIPECFQLPVHLFLRCPSTTFIGCSPALPTTFHLCPTNYFTSWPQGGNPMVSTPCHLLAEHHCTPPSTLFPNRSHWISQ